MVSRSAINLPMYRLMDMTAHMRTDGPSYAESSERAKAIAHGESASAAEVDALNLVPEIYRGSTANERASASSPTSIPKA